MKSGENRPFFQYIPYKEQKMTFKEKARGFLGKSVAITKDLAGKAGKKAKDLGEIGVIKIESAQLKAAAERLTTKLGNEVYVTLVDLSHATVSRDTPTIRDILAELQATRAKIAAKEAECATIGDRDRAESLTA
jgi:hypothetical protein